MVAAATDLDVLVISLARTPERLAGFQRRFHGLSSPCDGADAWRFATLPGVDGQVLDLQRLQQQGVLDAAALRWPRGQLGCALSHCRALLQSLRRSRPLMILEDDALPAPDWNQRLELLLRQAPVGWELLLLGWNLDSCLQLEWGAGQTFTSLFQPRFPSASAMAEALATVETRQWFRLHKALGLAGYVVSPAGAARILEWVFPLRTLPIQVPELPERACFSFDGQLNSLYPQLKAWAAFPPLLLGINDKPSSETAR